MDRADRAMADLDHQRLPEGQPGHPQDDGQRDDNGCERKMRGVYNAQAVWARLPLLAHTTAGVCRGIKKLTTFPNLQQLSYAARLHAAYGLGIDGWDAFHPLQT